MRTARQSQRARIGKPLRDFTFPESALDRDQQTQIVDTFIDVIDGLYAHLPLKRAMHGIDPVQQLRRLRDRVRTQLSAGLDDATFHAEMTRIVTSLRDAHTTYIGPSNLSGVVARLPFLVEEYVTRDRAGKPHRRYVASKVVRSEVADGNFVVGVELLSWNGVPMAAAIERHAERQRGGRPDSARARAVESLTFRPLRYGPRPDEDAVKLEYLGADGVTRTTDIVWSVVEPLAAVSGAHPTSPEALALAVHPDRAEMRRAKKAQFKHALWKKEPVDAARPVGALLGDPRRGWLRGRFQDAVSARIVERRGVEYGYLRLWSFDLLDDDAYIDEVTALLSRLPDNGLIIDLRGNPGGLIWAAERLLQLFTPRRVEPTRFSLVASDLTRAISGVRRHEASLGPWQKSLNDAVSTGELYSQAHPITPIERCNDIGQVYGGPAVAVVDPTSYSAADLFAAGFADNDIGTIVSVGEATGAGGANVWDADTINVVLAGTGTRLLLPQGVSFTIAVRRATRTGSFTGMPIEDVGVSGHRRYEMTRNDLLHDNVDLIDMCTSLLASEPRTDLRLEWKRPTLSITTQRLNRIDIYADDRPYTTLDVLRDGTVQIQLPDVELIRVEGYKGQNLSQARLYDNSADPDRPR